MLYIKKRRTPAKVKQKAAEIIDAPENGFASICLPKDAARLRSLFEDMPKGEIRKALWKEQHGLCAYCMRRIDLDSNTMKIEHYKALSKDKEAALDYQNYFGICYGGEKDEKEKPYILCCDASRKEKELTVNPWDKRQMEAIGYRRNGEIFVHGDRGLDIGLVKKMQDDLDFVLTLNGKKDAEGRVICDTASKLIASRRSIYQSICTQFERWDKKKCLTKDFLKEKVEYLEKQLQGDGIAEPYIGVRLYFYKRKYRKLEKGIGHKK